MNPEVPLQNISIDNMRNWNKRKQGGSLGINRQFCHSQLNELAETGVGWKTRNNYIGTKTKFESRSLKRKIHSRAITRLMTESDESSVFMRTSLAQDTNTIEKSKSLINGLQQLGKMHLLRVRNLNQTRFPGISRYAHIHNDYHIRSTNTGYSRNHLGRFYTK